MSSKIKIGLLCNNKMAVPAMMSLASAGLLCGVATADNDAEVVHVFGQMTLEQGILYRTITRDGFDLQLAGWINAMGADVIFVMTFPWRIPGHVLVMPRLGFLNFHYGLLPEMRGADPIFESIRQQKQIAGATVHVMNEQFDEGPIVKREELPLHAAYTYGMLCGQMAQLGNKLCMEVAGLLANGQSYTAIPQDEAAAQYWPKIDEKDLWIRWGEMTSETITALVRACNPIAKGVPMMINNWKIGICDISDVNLQGDASAIAPGTILAIDQQNGLVVCCRDGKAVKLEVVYTSEGVFPGYKLAFFGLAPGAVFSDEVDVGSSVRK